MHKTPIKRKHVAAALKLKKANHHVKNAKKDVAKIKSFLFGKTNSLKNAAGKKLNKTYKKIKTTSGEAHDYLSERPVKAMSVSLVTGLITGACVGYFIKDRYL